MCGTPVGGGNVSSVYLEDRVSLGSPRELLHSALRLLPLLIAWWWWNWLLSCLMVCWLIARVCSDLMAWVGCEAVGVCMSWWTTVFQLYEGRTLFMQNYAVNVTMLNCDLRWINKLLSNTTCLFLEFPEPHSPQPDNTTLKHIHRSGDRRHGPVVFVRMRWCLLRVSVWFPKSACFLPWCFRARCNLVSLPSLVWCSASSRRSGLAACRRIVLLSLSTRSHLGIM